MIVYCVKNIANGKLYVGKTIKTFPQRWATHCAVARRGSRLPLHRAIQKYGAASFELIVLLTCESIDGRKASAETRARMAESAKRGWEKRRRRWV